MGTRVSPWEWVNTVDPRDGVTPARRETNTMPQWAGSCWYYLRFIDPTNENAFVDGSLEKYWMPVEPGGSCSPRHRVPFDSRGGFTVRCMTWPAMSAVIFRHVIGCHSTQEAKV
jgi:hypothetical protein